MHQLDQFTYLTQFFWLLIFYIGFYVLLCYNGLPKIRSITESSKKGFLQALYSITLAIPFSLLFQELLPIAECASGDETSKPGFGLNKWAVPVAIALGGAKIIEKLPPKQRLPAFGVTVVAVTINTGICAGADLMKEIPKYPPAEPGSPRSGPFSPFEKIYTQFESFSDMSPYDQLEFMIKFIDAIALFGAFALSVYVLKMLLSNESLHSYLVEKFPLPNYRPWFEKVLSFFKLPGVLSNSFFLVIVAILFWDIHRICVILLRALGSSS